MNYWHKQTQMQIFDYGLLKDEFMSFIFANGLILVIKMK